MYLKQLLSTYVKQSMEIYTNVMVLERSSTLSLYIFLALVPCYPVIIAPSEVQEL